MKKYRYSDWDGTQDWSNLDADELMDKLSRDLLTRGSLSDILRKMQHSGWRDNQGRRWPGMEQMRERLRQMRQRQLDKYNLGSVVDEIRQKLQDILRKEREGIRRRLDEAKERSAAGGDELPREMREQLLKKIEDIAEKNRQQLDNLPPDLGGQIKELSNYDFMDGEARQEFQELMDMLKKHAMESYGRDMVQTLKNMDPSALANMRKMIEALNMMMEQNMRGEEPDFNGFMSQFGGYFGPNPPRSFEELIERLQQQISQAEALMNSLSPEDRQELQDLLSSMLDDATQYELAKLADNLGRLFPNEGMDRGYPFSGDESISFTEALKLMEELQKMDNLEEQLVRSQYDQSLDGIDEQLLKDLLGDEALGDLERLRELTKALEEAGYIVRKNGRWELTPRGIRKIGEKALHDIFARLHKDRIGGHDLKLKGSGGDMIEETKKYEPGDDFEIDLQQTIMNSLRREPHSPPVKLSVDDLEITRKEGTTRTAVVVMLDMSLSMFLNGYFDAARRTAFALNALIRSQYPRDSLHIIGFSLYAREVKMEDLLYMRRGISDQGTNLQHALSLANKILTKERCSNAQIILITDGEPTAHIENGYPFFEYPPSWRTLQLTLKEVKDCTKRGIVINTFMFDRSHSLSSFVYLMAHLNKGRVFSANADNLGRYVLVDYVARRKKTIG